ncbi:cytidylyltransferase domain-containing protein [Acetonema longum]|uniref:Acylneuraminate cytidylyltransferase n=1 Tax=Acetonema longum DSM 6540 TaxID=1009370 RepID=F7NNV4_9FIRM|nr:glycosyltransferase family protein [Acetonema longum]EGO62288.1 acylneuraminate cytidylyltransferase [Acetonema longum DSM 6540]
MRTVIIVQARMTSTRLPGKVLLPVLGKPLLAYQIERLRRVTAAAEIVIATTTNETDQPIVDLCSKMDIPFYRGSEADVLSRYYEAASLFRAEAVVRVTSDCPLIDPEIISNMIHRFHEGYPDCGYVSNVFPRTYPRGMDTEVFSFASLAEANKQADMPPDREHVTPYILRLHQPDRTANISCSQDHSIHRWTVDTPEDFELIRRMLESLYPVKPTFSLKDCLQTLAAHPNWALINRHIEQKKFSIQRRVCDERCSKENHSYPRRFLSCHWFRPCYALPHFGRNIGINGLQAYVYLSRLAGSYRPTDQR